MNDVARRETTPTAARHDAASEPDSPTIAPTDVAASARRTKQSHTEQARTDPQVAAARSRGAAEPVSPSEVPNQPAAESPAARTPVDVEAASGEVVRSVSVRPLPERRKLEGAERTLSTT